MMQRRRVSDGEACAGLDIIGAALSDELARRADFFVRKQHCLNDYLQRRPFREFTHSADILDACVKLAGLQKTDIHYHVNLCRLILHKEFCLNLLDIGRFLTGRERQRHAELGICAFQQLVHSFVIAGPCKAGSEAVFPAVGNHCLNIFQTAVQFQNARVHHISNVLQVQYIFSDFFHNVPPEIKNYISFTWMVYSDFPA